ncbi:helix-turn-helix domain-containing protein [Lentzea sp. BCCO 10_0061]|uniref:Helix-turn-helix domain-containing protein n=1 Tax=Lentzea sokolovensis TaxID=3095429 RepID=A0ABU4UUM1_9PSEU|nr:helix-turn-helix domain-containing protein [Lentzea sp. BCCO 10_0061]MDX8142370.1 helix-turn-helix domain-containing protein [Lentzea sp. BCCO 10_0061]
MRGLLLRLSGLDADAESAVRVIGFFDRLITERAGLDALVRTTSELAGCPVGLSAPGQGLALRADAGGAVTAGPVPARAAVRALEGGVQVWVAREGTPAPLDDMLLERFAIAAAVLLEHSSVPLPELGDPALVELVLSESVGTAERSRALHLLGIAATAPLRVLAATGEVPGKSVLLGNVRAVLGTEIPDVDGRLGVGPLLPAIEAARSWQAARTALRYTSDSEPVVWWERLGGLALLAEQLDTADIAALPDVRALDRLAAEPGMITMLDALCATGSVRKAAAVLHRHHSTMTVRLARAESVLGFELDSAGRFRLHLALMLRRLRDD